MTSGSRHTDSPFSFELTLRWPRYSAHPWASLLKEPLQAAFQSAPGRLVTHPGHILMYVTGGSLSCRLDSTRKILGNGLKRRLFCVTSLKNVISLNLLHQKSDIRHTTFM
ncbi:hypothetical protein D6C13_03290 [Rahnella woolbedingensis]|uniref:Uncharacterized protein n=1 Tax=Rahnella woolbedingensis TaxID=1510574 RepID=A0A419NDZ6_9GAMM|nr:hypothetical protein D6C13_03290 [Rahnella woolbedingensis]